MRYFLALLLLIPSLALAADVTLSWQPPTENVDGSPIAPQGEPGALDGYRIFIGYAAGGPYDEVYHEELSTNTSASFSFTLPDPQEGENPVYFVMTAYNNQGKTSSYSNEIMRTILIETLREPKPVIIITVDVQVDCPPEYVCLVE